MQVWILMRGEHQEGGTVLGVYATRELGHGAFAQEARSIHDSFGIDGTRMDENGSLHLDGGCDWLALELHDVTVQAEIAA